MKASIVNDIISKINEHMPPALKDCGEEFERSFRSALEAVLSKLDLVTREEFDKNWDMIFKKGEKNAKKKDND